MGSRVDEELTALNLESIAGVTGYDRLLYSSEIPRRNDGRLTNHWLKKYTHVESGGWWCGTVFDPLWGCFKPDRPRRDRDSRKPIKYEHPPRVATGLFALKVPIHIWERITARYGVPLPDHVALTPRLRSGSYDKDTLYSEFWEWVASSSLPVIITEGAKKAASLLSAGYIAVAVPGIFNGYRQPKDEGGEPAGSARLIPELNRFASQGRTIYFAFDQDEKPKTIANVRRAIAKTGWLLEQQGCKVRVIEWQPELGKGVDDLMVHSGAKGFQAAYESAQPLAVWKAHHLHCLTYEPNVSVNQRYLGSIPLPKERKLIGLKAPKGTGKTELLSQWVSEMIEDGQWVLVLTHRIQLGEALCQRFGVPYVTELRESETGAVFGYGLCVDSLHPNSQARFSAEHWEDGVVIVDEAEQVLWHMLNSPTCQSDRVSILRSLKTLVQNVLATDGRVILSDADLSDVSLDYIKSLSGQKLSPYIIQNEWKPEGWTVYQYGGRSPEGLVAELLERIEAGDKPFVCLSGQKRKSKWSTTNLERFLRERFPDKRILRIDSESVADPSHEAMGCVTQLNEILAEYDIVLASPSIETGVSIDIRGHFTSVWGISHGITPVSSFLQALSRLREGVERHIWVAERGLGAIGNGASSIKSLLASQHKLARGNIRLLQAAGFEELDDEGEFQQESLVTWAKIATRINATMPCYQACVVEALAAEGHRVIPVGDEGDRSGRQEAIAEGIKVTRDANYAAERQAIAGADAIDEKQYGALKEQRAKTKASRAQERKYELSLRYGVAVTPELVERDDAGWYPQLRLFYFSSLGREYLSERDKRAAQAQAEDGGGRLWKPDFNASQIGVKVAALDRLGVTALLGEPERELRDSDPEVLQIAALARSNPWQIKAILGISVGQNEAPIRLLGRLLGKIGVQLQYLRREGRRGDRHRVYRLAIPDDGRDEIFSVWLARDAARREEAEVVSTSPIDRKELESVDEKPPWIPAVGSFVRWLSGGAEKLVVLAVEASGQVQVRSLFSGLVTQTRPDRVAPLA